jgi:hypothetical protein
LQIGFALIRQFLGRANDLGGHPGHDHATGNVPGNDGVGADNDIVANRQTGHNDSTITDKLPIRNPDGLEDAFPKRQKLFGLATKPI